MALWTKENQADCHTIELISLSISTREERCNKLGIDVLKSRDLLEPCLDFDFVRSVACSRVSSLGPENEVVDIHSF